MIYAVYGVPRSGKSCYAVKKIVDATGLSPEEFFSAKKFHAHQFLKDALLSHCEKNPDGYNEIYHNIEGLNVFNDITGDEESFMLHNWEREPAVRRLLVLDECHRYLDRPSNELIHFFAYHGHYCFDIILITQSPYLINRKISVLAETELTAVRRSLRIGNELRYHEGAGGERTGMYVLKNTKPYFLCYKSANLHVKPKSQLTKMLLLVVVLVLVCFSCIGIFVSTFFDKGDAVASSAPPLPPPSPLKSAVQKGGGSPPRASGGERPPSHEWVEASFVRLEDGGKVSVNVLCDGVFLPLAKLLQEKRIVRSGRGYLICQPIKQKVQEKGDDEWISRSSL